MSQMTSPSIHDAYRGLTRTRSLGVVVRGQCDLGRCRRSFTKNEADR